MKGKGCRKEKIRECRPQRADAGSAGSLLQQNESFMPLLCPSRFYGASQRSRERFATDSLFLQTREEKEKNQFVRLID